MPTSPAEAPAVPCAPALSPYGRPENCYCSALPRGSGPCLPRYVRRLRLAEASRQRGPAKLGERRRLGSDGLPGSPRRWSSRAGVAYGTLATSQERGSISAFGQTGH
jgi:hypothetical protein